MVLFFSCQQHSQWVCHPIKERNYQCTRILYQTEDPVSGIDLEFLQMTDKLSSYLQVHSHPLIPSKMDPNKVQITLSTSRKQMTFLAAFHLGKQRISLSQIIQDELLALLNQTEPFTIELAGYQEIITPKKLTKILKVLDRSS